MAIPKPRKEKYVTMTRFDRAMASIAQSFQRIEGALSIIIRDLQGLKSGHEELAKTLTDHAIHISRHERSIDNLTDRIETIEGSA